MPSHLPLSPFAPLVLIGLSACSSPPGGSTQSDDAQPAAWQVVLPDAAPFTTRTELPENGAVALQGQVHTAHVRLDPTQSRFSGSISDFDEYMVPANPVADGTLVLTYENGELVAGHLADGTSGFAIDTRKGDAISADDAVYETYMTGGPSDAISRFVRPSAHGMDHMSYGRWWTNQTDTSATVGTGVFGANTPETAMPASGAATYRGTGLGFFDSNQGGIRTTEFDVSVTTSDFNTITIQSSNTVIANQIHSNEPVNVDDLNFSGTGTISGSRVTADIASADLAGTAEGQFFGANAEEFGATFAMEGGNATHIGAFGASR